MIRFNDTIEAMAAALDGTPYGPVYRHRLPAPPADPPNDRSGWHRAVVRRLAGAELRETATGLVAVPVQVAVQCAGYQDPDLFLDAAHEALQTVLEGLRPQTAHGSAYLHIERYTWPQAPVWDEETRSYTSAATYLIALRPNDRSAN